MNIKVDTNDPAVVVSCIIEQAKARFVESVDVAVNSTVSKKDGTTIKTYVVLPHSVAKAIRVAVFTDDATQVAEAKASGADIVGCDDLLADILAGKIDFDVLISTPSMMSRLSKVAKVIGSKGLMPNVKLGTLSDKVGSAVRETKAGRVYLKSDDFGTIHAKIGNVSMSPESLVSNMSAVLLAINSGVGSNVKNFRIKSVFVNSTMGRSYKLAGSAIMSKKQ